MRLAGSPSFCFGWHSGSGCSATGAVEVTHDLTQDEIAQLVGASRETVNKVLSDFTNRGWIRLRGKGVIISEAERLALRADLRPAQPTY